MSQTEYEIQDFEAINNAINDEHQKSLNKIKERRSLFFKRYMIYGSLFLFAISILLLSIGFIYWFISEKPKNLISKNEYITNNYELEKNISQLEKIIERNKTYEENNTETIINNDQIVNQIIKEEFYLFKTLEYQMSNSKTIKISTGQIFDPDKIEFPSRQYCYTMIEDNEVEVRIFLSNKDAKNNKIDTNYKNNYKNLINYSDFRNAQTYCRFKDY